MYLRLHSEITNYGQLFSYCGGFLLLPVSGCWSAIAVIAPQIQ